MLSYKVKSPILLIIFNRPETTIEVFNSIKLSKPTKLYIAADGPRSSVVSDKLLCEKTREIVNQIDWNCNVRTLFRESNLGCKIAVSEAISWFFENETEGIILEDDVVPISSFFPFCDELLEKYRYANNIGSITGNNLISEYFNPKESYFFSHYANIWGWATWKRVWDNYDVDLRNWKTDKTSGVIDMFSDNTPFFSAYWKDQIDAIYSGKMDTWDFQFFLTCWKLNALCIVPKNNLIQNIGFGKLATHTTGSEPKCVTESYPKELSFPLTHPSKIYRSIDADRTINNNVFNIRLITLIKWKIRRIPYIGNVLSLIKRILIKLYSK